MALIRNPMEGHSPGPLPPLRGTVLSQGWTGHFSAFHWGTQLLPHHPRPRPGAGSRAGPVLTSCHILQPASILCVSAHSMRRGADSQGPTRGGGACLSQRPAGRLLRWMGSGLVPGPGPPPPRMGLQRARSMKCLLSRFGDTRWKNACEPVGDRRGQGSSHRTDMAQGLCDFL